MGFSNGDPITAYDVWYTMIRAILFQGGYPGDADWILCKYLFPVGTPPLNFQPFVSIVNDTNKAVAFSAIVNAVSYNNDSQTVTFHLAIAKSPAEFFTSINDALGTGILDAAWLKSVGAGITFTPDGFLAYQDQANEGSYNLQVQYHPVASGPFEINTYVPATAVVLTPNPYFPGIPAIPKQDKTVILKWVSSPAVAYQLFASGQGDIVTVLPPPYYKTINTGLVPNQAHIEGPFPTITEFFVVFNVNIATSLISTDIGPGYSIPSDYFANPLVREAFAYAFNYTQYVDQILGNKKYGFNFGSPYCGVIVKGLPYYVPPTGLPGCPTYDLAKAKSLLYQSGEYNTSVKIPIVVPTGDDTDFLAAQVLSAALAFIDSNIVMTPVSITFHNIIGYSTPGANPMPIYFLGWIADYPYPSDYTDAMYLEKGTYPGPNGWDQTYLNGLAAAHPTEAALYRAQASAFANLTANITAADTATSAATAAADYAVAEQWGGPSVFIALYINPHLTGSARQQLVDQLTARFHLNDPIYVQYFYWLGAILQGDWGTSAQNGQAVTTNFVWFMPNTIMLTVVASLLTWVISIPIGVYSATRRDSVLDQGVRVATFTLYSMPIFLIGFALFLTFGTSWHLLPAQGNLAE